jgi:hypothetical protein
MKKKLKLCAAGVAGAVGIVFGVVVWLQWVST